MQEKTVNYHYTATQPLHGTDLCATFAQRLLLCVCIVIPLSKERPQYKRGAACFTPRTRGVLPIDLAPYATLQPPRRSGAYIHYSVKHAFSTLGLTFHSLISGSMFDMIYHQGLSPLCLFAVLIEHDQRGCDCCG